MRSELESFLEEEKVAYTQSDPYLGVTSQILGSPNGRLLMFDFIVDIYRPYMDTH